MARVHVGRELAVQVEVGLEPRPSEKGWRGLPLCPGLALSPQPDVVILKEFHVIPASSGLFIPKAPAAVLKQCDCSFERACWAVCMEDSPVCWSVVFGFLTAPVTMPSLLSFPWSLSSLCPCVLQTLGTP